MWDKRAVHLRGACVFGDVHLRLRGALLLKWRARDSVYLVACLLYPRKMPYVHERFHKQVYYGCVCPVMLRALLALMYLDESLTPP